MSGNDDFINDMFGDSTKVDRSNLQWADTIQVDIAMLTVTFERDGVLLCAPLHSVLNGMRAASKAMYDRFIIDANTNNNDSNNTTES